MERAQLIALVRATGCAVERDGGFFLGDAGAALTRTSNLEVPEAEVLNPTFNAQRLTLNAQVAEGWLAIATGGTSGGGRFARHDERTLTAAVLGFCAHFEIEQVNAVDVLPAYHVSGLMARVRCAETDGEHVAWDWKRLEAGERPQVARAKKWMISLVPTQLQRLLMSSEAVAWLRGFEIIFIGGGPVWPELAEAAARAGLRVALSYGMTETAAMVAALRPEEFLAGERNCGAVLPHARVAVDENGVVRTAGESVFRGYWPETRESREFVTEDLGRFDERGHLHILGRRDAVIITGGEKVQPEEVEAGLRASGEFSDVAVVGVPDAEWGEAVVACYAADERAPNFERAVAGLAGFQRPKRFVAVADWPRNEQGKISRAALRALAGGMGSK